MKVMGSLEAETEEEKGEFWFSNLGLPLNDKYRPIYEKYYDLRKTMSDFRGSYQA